MIDYNKFQGCNIDVCSRKIKGSKTVNNYLIERTCRYNKIDVCPFNYHLNNISNTSNNQYQNTRISNDSK